mmetsp:Transcript_25358/g.50523  ORF Transcript_25358/g.50523 Transcript_25358/m.50523 type:complete len:1045 (-) Transcript_25358:82-3216(-)
MPDEEELYDEFGNYIGPELDSSEDEESSAGVGGSGRSDGDDGSSLNDAEEGPLSLLPSDAAPVAVGAPQNAIVLHEDIEYYPSASSVYGPDVATATLEEDAMDVDTPIIEPVKFKDIRADEGKGERTPKGGKKKSKDDRPAADRYVSHLMTLPGLQRCVATVGHLQSGKTSLLDLLAPGAPSENRGRRHTDTLQSEADRGMSLKSCPAAVLCAPSSGKTHLVTAVDCPGHTGLFDECVAGIAASDGVVLVCDAVDGVGMGGGMAIRAAIRGGLRIVLVINKIDRIITELRLPPNDAYYKILHTIEEAQGIIDSVTANHPRLDPAEGNVVFCSAAHGWTFTLETLAETYGDAYAGLGEEEDVGNGEEDGSPEDDGAAAIRRKFLPPKELSARDLGRRLWGEWRMHPRSRHFTQSGAAGAPRSFVQFVLEPIYKIYGVCLGGNDEPGHEDNVADVLAELGVRLSVKVAATDAKDVIAEAMGAFLGTGGVGLVDAIVRHVPPPNRSAKLKVSRNYTGPQTSLHALSMSRCDPRGPLMIHLVKLYSSPDGRSFSCFGRVYSGTLKVGDRVRVLGEAYSPEDGEDASFAVVDGLRVPRGRSGMEVAEVMAGCWVLIDGIDGAVAKTATLTSEVGESAGEGPYGGDGDDDGAEIFAPLQFPEAGGEPVAKLAVEPLNPAELPKMVEGLRRVSKSYPMSRTKVEESGEHVVYGTGELYLDCIMHDLRHVFSDVEIKVADPIVAFCETVVESSSLKCFSETPNKRNKLTFIAEPLDDGLAEKIESGKINLGWDKKKTGRFFQSQYRWDLLSARSVWAFGPSPTRGPNILLDDTLPTEVDKDALQQCRRSIVQGFQWACREGPLCEEPVRGTKVKILDAVLADQAVMRGGGQVIPAARRAVYSSLLTAAPRLMEPVYRLEIQCPGGIVANVLPLITRRRGHVVRDAPVPGTPFVLVSAYLPVLDSFGFETDLRTFTQGQAMVFSVFDHWTVAPGDPLDSDIVLHPLEPSPVQHLAREIMVKTRRRKGLSEDVSVTKFFDEAMRVQLRELEEMN